MKLTEVEINAIEKYLAKDRIFYDDIRMEMTDHIATTLEEQLNEGDDFDAVLKAYMHSHLKVKLLTAAKEQELIRDRQNRNKIFSQFTEKRGIAFFAIIFLLIQISTFEVWAFRAFEAVMIIGIFAYMVSEPWMPKRFLFVKRFTTASWYYYVITMLFVLKINNFFGEDQWVYCIKGVVLSVIFTTYYLVMRMNNDILKNNRYA
ncbi:hypothetical protein ACX0HA_09710 [Flavobacterium hauense]